MIIPIRTETEIRRTPVANYALIAANILLFVFIDLGRNPSLIHFKLQHFVLHGRAPSIYQFLTYQFSHADGAHLLGNMLFLWVFGNAVNAKLGNLTYVLFYLAGGVFAAFGFALTSNADLLGASGSIAAITTAYLVLFPRSHVTVLYVIFFIGTFDLPAILLIGLKVVLWDNIIAPQIGGAGNVAIGAHLAGYLFGFAVTLFMLFIHVVPRDKFDLLSLWKRWHQRQAYRSMMEDPRARAKAEYGRVARPVTVSPEQRQAEEQQLDRISSLRARIAEYLMEGEVGSAVALYEQLMELDPKQCLSARDQITIGREFYSTNRAPQAAAAFERYLASYKNQAEAPEVQLLLGIIYARDLQQYEAAVKHLTAAEKWLTNPDRKAQAARWLNEVSASQGEA